MTTLRSRLNQEYHNVELSFIDDDGRDNANFIELTIADVEDKTARTRLQNEPPKYRKPSSFPFKEVIDKKNKHDEVADLLNVSASNPFKEPKKSVSFARKMRVRKIPSMSSMPTSVIEDSWFFPDDFESMKQECEYLLFFMERGDSDIIDEDCDSTRGLEYKTEEGAWQRLQQRRCVFDAVLNEQDRQRMEGISEPSIIAQLYQECNKVSIKSALEIAREDEIAVKEYLSSAKTDATEVMYVCDNMNDEMKKSARRWTIPTERKREVGEVALQKVYDIHDESAPNQHARRRWSTPRNLEQIHTGNKKIEGSQRVEYHDGSSWLLTSKGKRTHVESTRGKVNNENTIVDGDGGAHTSRRWEPLPRNQRKNLFDMWHIEDILAKMNN